MSSDRKNHYEPQDAVGAGIKGALTAGGVGLLASAAQNALQKRNVGTWGVFTRSGGTVATFTAVGGIYRFSTLVAANLREKNDPVNTAIGGFLAGSVVGLRGGGMPAVVGYGAFTAAVLFAFDFTGGKLSGKNRDPEIDEFERKERLRKNRRRPIEETIAELGEGRGIQAPGYEERRRQHIKEKYGIDINPVSVRAD